MSRRTFKLALMTFALGASLPALADDMHYNQVSLRAEVSQEVPADLMSVTVYTEAQNRDPGKLASQVTETLNKAVEQARQAKGIKVTQGARNSSPVYDEKDEKIINWREHAELNLESSDFAALSQLTGELLTTMKMGDMSFSIAPATRKTSEDALFKEALAAFKARAQLTTEGLGGTGYKVVNLNLNTSGYGRPMPRMAAMSDMLRKAAPAPVTPQVEGGTSLVSITAEGVIEVQIQ